MGGGEGVEGCKGNKWGWVKNRRVRGGVGGELQKGWGAAGKKGRMGRELQGRGGELQWKGWGGWRTAEEGVEGWAKGRQTGAEERWRMAEEGIELVKNC